MNRTHRTWRNPIRLLITIALLAGPTARVAAPRAQVGVSSWTGNPTFPQASVSPSFQFDGAHARVRGSGLATAADGVRSGQIDAALLLLPLSRRALELRLETASRDVPEGLPLTGGRAEARVHFTSGRSGAWAALAAERGRGISDQRFRGSGTLVGLGVWARSHGARVALDLEQRGAYMARPRLRSVSGSDSLATAPAPANAGDVPLRGTLTIARAAVRWEGERLAFESTGGLTLSLVGTPRRWASAGIRARLTPRLSAFATLGSQDRSNYVVPPTESPGTSVGIEIAQGHPDELRPLVDRAALSDWTVRRVDSGTYALGVRAPSARLVEIAGDFTDWQPVTLERTGYERWQFVTPLPPGLHRVNLRVDGGAWCSPPGVPATVDGFGGNSGQIVVE